MVWSEMLLLLVAIVSSFIALAVTVFSWRRQRNLTQEQRDAIERTLSPAKLETFESVISQLKNRKTALREAAKELRSSKTGRFKELWLDELAKIVMEKKQQKGG